MAPSTLSKRLLAAARAFDLAKVSSLVKAGARTDAAFLSDQGSAIDSDTPKAKAIFDRLSAPGSTVNDEKGALFALYEALLLAGHPVPDAHSRHCLVRVIAGADTQRQQRAFDLMQVCVAQNMLSWASSQWAMEKSRATPDADSMSQYLHSLDAPHSNGLYAEAFGAAAAAGNLPLLRYLATHVPEGVVGKKSVFVDFSSPVHKAAAAGHIGAVEYLLTLMPEQAWCLAAPHTTVTNPLLMVAARHGQEKMVCWLLDHGADINAPGARGEGSALVAALDGRHENIVRLLLERGADPNAVEKGPGTLHMALWRGDTALVDLLLSHGASSHRPDDSGITPLMMAAMVGHASALLRLLDEGAVVDSQDRQGMTAMTVACRSGRAEIFTILLDRGARLDTPDKEGKVPEDHATPHIKAMIHAHACEQSTPLVPQAQGRSPRI